MKTAWHFLALIFIALSFPLRAQVPAWEDSVRLDLPAGRSVESVFSNGYGQHIGVARTINARHCLVGNNGATVFVSPDLGGSQQGVTAVTAFGSFVNVANRQNVGPGHDVIRLWRSSDGGEHWPGTAFEYDPATHFSIQNIVAIDAHADARGVHIVWQSGNEVYYVLYDDVIQQDFIFPKQVSDLDPSTGAAPKIVTSANKAHVSFIRTDLASDSVVTRDATFSSKTPPIAWEGSYETIPYFHDTNQNAWYQSIVRSGDTLHLAFQVVSTAIGGTHRVFATKRAVSGPSWLATTWLDNFAKSSGIDNRRCLAVVGDTVYLVFNPASQSTTQLYLRVHTPAAGWSNPTTVVSSGNGQYQFPSISASRTGVYFFWHRDNYSTTVMRRKVYSLTGQIAETMFFTGNNWITSDLTIDPGSTGTLKAASTTYVSDNKKLIVANGGTLKKERGSQIVFGTGAKYQLNATLLNSCNMTGIPAVLPNFDTSAVYPTATSMVFSYNPNAGGYVVTNPLSNDRGFFVKFGYAQNHVYEGGYIDSIAMNAYNGWNIIGSISSPIDTAMVYSSPPGIVVLPYYKYTSTGYVPVTSLVPGAGYWVKTSSAGKIILNLRSQPGSPPAQQEDQLDTYDRFTITDANGAEQSLYVRNAVLAGTTEDLEMPPPPPGAEFDARFLSGDFLKTVNPDSGVVQLDIAVEAVALPVTLSWQVNPENAIQYSLGGGELGKVSRSGEQSTIASSGSLPIASNGTIRLSGQPRLADRRAGLPLNFALHQSYPNPFNPTTNIAFDLPGDSRVDLVVLDLLGRQVAILIDGVTSAGRHNVTFDASGLASGVYFCRLQATALEGGYSLHDVKKLLLLR